MDVLKRNFPGLFIKAIEPTQLTKEAFYGNIEYKRTLIGITDTKIKAYATQMLWRINENGKQAIYWIGVDDDGTKIGIDTEELTETITKLLAIATEINATVSAVYLQPINDKYVIKANVRAKTNQSFVFDL